MSDQGTIILCPGQGAQHVGMGRAWAEASDAAHDTYSAADKQLGFKLSDVCFNGPESEVTKTSVAQAAIYVTTVAAVRGLVERGALSLDSVVAAAGLSLGEYTALHLAGVLSFEDGLTLVQNRGAYMQEAAEASGGSMVAIIGADAAQVDELCDKARDNEILVPANFNCPGQIVISGSKGACNRSLQVAEKMGVRATALTVAGAFHSPLMQPAADRMAERLDAVSFGPARVPVLSNVTGAPHRDDAAIIKQLLVDQITHPVKWEQNVRWLLDNVAGQYIEPAPGKALGGMMRRIDRGTKVANHAEPK